MRNTLVIGVLLAGGLSSLAEAPLTPKQLAAIVGSVDVKSPSLMTIGAYIATQVIDGDRAEANLMLDWPEVRTLK